MNGRAASIAGLAAAVIGGAGAAKALELEQFATGWPLELPADRGVFDVPLTHEIYRYAGSFDQLAVLDRNGEPMPFYRVVVEPESALEQRIVLDASPLYAVTPGGAAGVDVTAGLDGARVTLSPPPEGRPAEVVGFVVDARAVERAPVAIELDWPDLERPFLFGVAVEHSRTLTGWRTIGRGSIAELQFDGAKTRHARIEIAGERGGYYRVGVEPSVPEWRLRGATLIVSEGRREPALRSVTLEPTRPAGDTTPEGMPPERENLDELTFDAGGRMPVVALTLEFPDGDGWVRAAVAAADSPDGPWREIVPSRLFYQAALNGRSLSSEPVEIRRTEARYYRVRLGPDARPAAIALRLEYPPERLRFAARGEPPYTLAGGTLADEAGPDPTFAAVWPQLEAVGGAAAQASVGARTQLGGRAALQPPFAFPWRSALLWAVLAAGVVVVGSMALRLVRDMSRRA